MFAVLQDRNKQYTVKTGDTITIDTLPEAKAGEEIVFDKVLYIGGEKAKVGTPTVSGAKVIGKVAKPVEKGLRVFTVSWRRREQYQRRVGHRQKYTTVKITDIQV